MDKASLIEAVNGHIDDKAITPRVLQQWWSKVSQNIDIGGGGSSPGGILGDIPVGAQIPFGGGSVPNGWLLCDGSAVSRTTYADLFAVIGTSYGAGDGSKTFNLPDKRGRVSVGKNSSDTDFATIGKDGGAKTVKLETTHMPSHTHTGTTSENGSHTHSYNGWWTFQQGYYDGAIARTRQSDAAQTDPFNAAGNHTHTFTTAATGGGTAHNNLQPYETDNWIIKALPIVSSISIGNNDNWYIDGVDTGHSSRGKTGDTGAKGDKGDKGDRGDTGLQGPIGPTGATGPQGSTGPQGPKGDPFTYNDFTEEQLKALTGPKGDQGQTGPQGPIGPAFTYSDFTPEQLASLTGPKGDKGDKGDTGPQGDPGPMPVFTIGEVESLEPGDEPYVRQRGTAAEPILDFGIPGADGGNAKVIIDRWEAE